LFEGISFGLLAVFIDEAIARSRAHIAANMRRRSIEDLLLKNSKDALKNIKVALVVVDYQNDFVTGSLAIGAGDAGEDPVARIWNINRLIDLDFDAIVITKDWHPADHISFLSAAKNSDRRLSAEFASRDIELFEKVSFKEPRREQVLYPDHCVANTHGAELVPQMKVPERAVIVNKGLDTLVDSYSAFMDNEGDKKSELHEVLKAASIDAVVVCGLAYDICVFHTVKDARNFGFYCATARDASAAFSSGGARQAAEYHAENLIKEMSTDDIVEMMKSRKFPQEWVKCAIDEDKLQNNNSISALKQ
ncbi:hypothetical protein PMAYCL1PPCAC_31890, partial [Pristionchus mayeri]